MASPAPTTTTQTVLMYVTLAEQLLGTFGPLALDGALKIKTLLEASPDVAVELKNVGGDVVTTSEHTMKMLNDWRVKNGFPALT